MRTARELQARHELVTAATHFIAAGTLDRTERKSPLFDAAVSVVVADGMEFAALRDGTRLKRVLSRADLRRMAREGR
jgi:hypothetical protein